MNADGCESALSPLSSELSSENQPCDPERRTAVIILERDGSLHCEGSNESIDARHKASIDIPAELINVPNPGKIIDRILDFAFDRLGLQSLELRVYEERER
jgi:hypothetical protein